MHLSLFSCIDTFISFIFYLLIKSGLPCDNVFFFLRLLEHFTFSCPLVNKCRTNFDIQLILEKQGFELCESTYMHIFSIVSPTILQDLLLVESIGSESRLRSNCVNGGQTISYMWIFDFVECRLAYQLHCSKVHPKSYLWRSFEKASSNTLDTNLP